MKFSTLFLLFYIHPASPDAPLASVVELVAYATVPRTDYGTRRWRLRCCTLHSYLQCRLSEHSQLAVRFPLPRGSGLRSFDLRS